MLKRFLAAGAACICAVAAFDTAFAQSTLTVHRRYNIPMPADVMTSDNWLDPGEVVPVRSEDNYARMVEAPSDVQVGPDLGQNW